MKPTFVQKAGDQPINIDIDRKSEYKYTYHIRIQKTFFMKAAIHILKRQKTDQ